MDVNLRKNGYAAEGLLSMANVEDKTTTTLDRDKSSEQKQKRVTVGVN